jgi:hypothetical protein
MINKYSGITLVLIATLSLLVSWTMYKKYTKNFYIPKPTIVDSRKLLQKVQIKKESFTNLTIMNQVVDRLVQNRGSTLQSDSIALSPYRDIEERPILEQPTDLEKKKRFAANICRKAKRLQVSMSFVADNDRYAVVADKFVRIGQKAGDKFKVTGIDSDKITVRKSGINCTVKVTG